MEGEIFKLKGKQAPLFLDKTFPGLKISIRKNVLEASCSSLNLHNLKDYLQKINYLEEEE